MWNLKATCAVAGARYPQIPLGLITVAALLPADWECRLVDRNTSELTDADLDWAELVMTGGMNVQRPDCEAVIERAQARGRPVVVGGPDVMSEPQAYAGVDFVVVGEAEGVIDQLVAAWNAGERRGTFRAEKFTADITRTPVPRYDLLRRADYLHYSVQFSRGCPFTCEFCDIIELYGRVPRVKTIDQMLGELEALYRAGYRGHVDFVDDNFIGNKKAVKALLPHLVDWQRERHYPFWFTTEASINLADDAELLALMRSANFGLVFVGIESPDEDTLVAMRKKQNARRSLAGSVHRIQSAGLIVAGGFIFGFDSERDSMANSMIACIEEAAIPMCFLGLLLALPNTQLYRRLEHEGRLFPWSWLAEVFREQGGDQCTLGLNFETRRPRRDILRDYRRALDALYAPRAYFARVRQVAARLGPWPAYGAAPQAVARWRFLGLSDLDWLPLLRLLRAALRAGPGTLVHVVLTLLWAARTDSRRLGAVGLLAAVYLHLGPFARSVSASAKRQIAAIDCGDWQPPLMVARPPGDTTGASPSGRERVVAASG
jgi:radical SAM superfamily enzyme YgiQ (UPF0313 family)